MFRNRIQDMWEILRTFPGVVGLFLLLALEKLMMAFGFRSQEH